MNTPGTVYITGKIVSATESTGISNSWRKIRAAWYENPRFRKNKRARITIKEYVEYHGFDLNEYVMQVNEKCKMKIVNNENNNVN